VAQGVGPEFKFQYYKKKKESKRKAKLDLLKIKTFSSSTDTIKKMRRKPSRWEKYLQIIYLIRGLSTVYK
jgi:hypothetical protein